MHDRLQKEVYYCQAWSLGWDEQPLFEEDFEAWANGPVCPELFQKHKGQFLVDVSLFADIPDYEFTEDEIATMTEVLKYYGDKEPQWLSELTHKEEPWKSARVGVPKKHPVWAFNRCDKTHERWAIKQCKCIHEEIIDKLILYQIL